MEILLQEKKNIKKEKVWFLCNQGNNMWKKKFDGEIKCMWRRKKRKDGWKSKNKTIKL